MNGYRIVDLSLPIKIAKNPLVEILPAMAFAGAGALRRMSVMYQAATGDRRRAGAAGLFSTELLRTSRR